MSTGAILSFLSLQMPPHPRLDNPTSSSSLHPYSIVEKRKKRKTWNHLHTLESQVFSSDEIAHEAAPERRKIYLASLESHIEALHEHLRSIGLYPVKEEDLEKYKGLNSKTAKSMIATLDYRASRTKAKKEYFQNEVKRMSR